MTRSRQKKQARPGDTSPPSTGAESGAPSAPEPHTPEPREEIETGSRDEIEAAAIPEDAINEPEAAPEMSATTEPPDTAPADEPVAAARTRPPDREEPPAEPPHMPPAVAQPPSRSPWPAALGGGIVGAIIVGAVAYYLLSGPRPDPALAARVAQLESQTQQIGSEAGKVGGLAGEVGKLQERVGSAVADPAIMSRLQKVEGTSSEAQQQAQDLGGKLAALGRTVDGLPKSQPDLGPLQSRISALEDGLKKQQTALTQGLDQRQAALSEQAGKLTTTIDDRAKQIESDVASTKSATSDLAKKLDALEQQVANLRLVSERGAKLALAIADAQQALNSSTPLEPAIQRLQGLANNDSEIKAAAEALAQASSKGITPKAELRQKLEALRPQLGPGAQASSGGGDWAETAVRNLGKLVTVQPVGQATEQQRDAVDRALAALDRNDLASARDAIAPLARSGDDAAKAWVDAASTRLDAQAAIDRLHDRLQAILTAAS
jgi:hypothetical protein